MSVFHILPPVLGMFGVVWYIHVVKIIDNRIDPHPPFVGLMLFYVPFLAIVIPLFISSGAHGILVALATIITIPMSTVLFTSAVIKKFDGLIIIAFLALNLGLFGGLLLLA